MAVVTALMSGANNFQQMQILQHPLLETFLRFKWHRLRMIFGMLVVVHACFVASLSTYCLLLVYNNNNSSFIEVVKLKRDQQFFSVKWQLILNATGKIL
jgi:hypothetical protein